jgi:hypothetical protein
MVDLESIKAQVLELSPADQLTLCSFVQNLLQWQACHRIDPVPKGLEEWEYQVKVQCSLNDHRAGVYSRSPGNMLEGFGTAEVAISCGQASSLQLIKAMISMSEEYILLIQYTFDHSEIVQLLSHKLDAGIKVYVLMDESQFSYGESRRAPQAMQTLKERGANLSTIRRRNTTSQPGLHQHQLQCVCLATDDQSFRSRYQEFLPRARRKAQQRIMEG